MNPECPEWLAWVTGRPDAGPFHHPAWARCISALYGFTTRCEALRHDSGAIVAGLPCIEVPRLGRGRTCVCLPFTDSCKPLGEPEPVRRLLNSLGEQREEHWEVRAAAQVDAFRSATVGFLHVLDLSQGADHVLRRSHKSHVQRSLRKAQRDAIVRIRQAERESDLTQLYYGLHAATRKRQGVPPQPRRLFKALWRELHTQGLAWTLLAEVDSKPVAGAVFLEWNRQVVYKYGASIPAAWRLRPNHLLFWHAITRACESDAAILDLGRTDFHNEGLRAFKRSWGAEEHPLVYSWSGQSPRIRPAGPASLILGTLIRHSPLAVNELIGTLLYRFAA